MPASTQISEIVQSPTPRKIPKRLITATIDGSSNIGSLSLESFVYTAILFISISLFHSRIDNHTGRRRDNYVHFHVMRFSLYLINNLKLIADSDFYSSH